MRDCVTALLWKTLQQETGRIVCDDIVLLQLCIYMLCMHSCMRRGWEEATAPSETATDSSELRLSSSCSSPSLCSSATFGRSREPGRSGGSAGNSGTFGATVKQLGPDRTGLDCVVSAPQEQEVPPCGNKQRKSVSQAHEQSLQSCLF